MSTTQPIRDLKDIQRLKDYFLAKGEIRNYAIIVLGLNTPIRIGDLLQLRWGDVYDFEIKQYKKHITLIEKKTGKKNMLALNCAVCDALCLLQNYTDNVCEESYLFKSRCGINKPICRTRAFAILKHAARELHLGENISCHSLRKTFGYQAWKRGVPPAILMDIYNHSSIHITKRYLCINQDDKDEVLLKLNL